MSSTCGPAALGVFCFSLLRIEPRDLSGCSFPCCVVRSGSDRLEPVHASTGV